MLHPITFQKGFVSEDALYTTQLIPLSVLMTALGDRAEDGLVKDKLVAWYWCGVFGEMYGAANETRYANDLSGALAWLDENLQSHVIDVVSLRADDFQTFFICRAKALLNMKRRKRR